MSCFNPIDAWRSQRLNDSGRRSITFSLREGFQDMHLQVPCGRCDGCRADRAMMWSIRMHHEASQHERNSFLTLTYADPSPERLNKKHLQDFFKRARHSYDFRYFAVGEYGSSTHRPHYHALIFGEDFWSGKIDINSELYTNERLAEIWGHGMVSVGTVTMASCCYVAGYVNKKIGDEDTFSLMSRRPGIGHAWLDKYCDDIVRTGSVSIEGREYPVPKRYLLWKEEELEHVRINRKNKARITPTELFERRDTLDSKALNKKSQLTFRGKKI